MIMGKPLTASVSGGLKPQIIVTAPGGSTVKLDGVTGSEVSGVWTFDDVSIGNHTVTATNYGITITVTVNVDSVAIFNVPIVFTKTVALTGAFSSSYGYVTIGGTKYYSSGSHAVPIGSQIGITVDGSSSCEITLNGVAVKSGTGTYNYTVNTDCSIAFTKHHSIWSGDYYTAAITT